MARGIDTSQDPKRSLHNAIKAETDTQNYMFGGLVGSQDDGHRTVKRPGPPLGGQFHGAEPNAIRLAQMQDNRRQAMAGIMQPPPTNDRGVEGLVDTQLGRLSDGVERPVHSYVDENVKKR